jgi:hypothetical protein
LIASKKLNVRLRPELKAGENFSAEDEVEQGIASGAGDTEPGLFSLILKMRSSLPPQALLEDIVTTVQDPFLGLEALALASICERNELTPKLEKLPPIPGLAETPEAKIGLARAWLRCWRNFGFWLAGMPSTWRNRSKAEGVSVKDKKGKGKFDAMDVVITDRAARKVFNDKWTPELLALFAVDLGGLINCAAANYRFNSMAHGRVVLLANPFTGPYLELRTALIAGVRKSLRSILTSIPHSWPGRAITAGR